MGDPFATTLTCLHLPPLHSHTWPQCVTVRGFVLVKWVKDFLKVPMVHEQTATASIPSTKSVTRVFCRRRHWLCWMGQIISRCETCNTRLSAAVCVCAFRVCGDTQMIAEQLDKKLRAHLKLPRNNLFKVRFLCCCTSTVSVQ